MKIKKWELILIAALIAGLALWAFFPRSAGRAVTVTVDGDTIGKYPLSRDLRQEIHGHGSFSLTLVIAGGKAHVENSTCPDLICQHHAPISRAGEQIICLPARTVVTVTGKEAGADAVTQ